MYKQGERLREKKEEEEVIRGGGGEVQSVSTSLDIVWCAVWVYGCNAAKRPAGGGQGGGPQPDEYRGQQARAWC